MNECLGLERGYNEDSFLLDRCYDSLYHLFVSNGLFWLLLILGNSSYRKNMVFKSHGIHLDNIFQLINHLPSMVSVAHLLGVDLTDFSCLISIHKNIECMDDLSLAILGENMIDILCRRLEFTNRDELEVVRKARELVSLASKRTCSTVPYIEGDCLNYHYAMYDHLDNDVLLSGILTDACFRIDGNDNDFFHYCVLNKNGFVIKITDYAGNFIARGSGFRNGNIVYVNQLRTIYDSSDNHYCGEYLHEQKDIIETFRKACFDIVNISQENDNEVSKIDFVFVTQSYSLKILDSNVAVPVADKIGNSLIDEASLDWKHFVENTPNLFESSDGHQFNTDYGNYPIICMASSKRVEDIGCNDIRLGDVFALYQRKRGDISIFLKNDSLLVKRLNKLKAIQAYYKKDKFQAVVIPAGAMTFMGDNWFIIWYQGEIVDCCLLEEDNAAKMEFRSVLEVIQNNSSDYSHLLKLEQELALVFDAKVKARILKRD